MRIIHEIATYLAAASVLASPGGENELPTHSNILDEALCELKPLLPERFREHLSFGNSRTGFRCYELDDILFAMRADCLAEGHATVLPGLRMTIFADTARRLLRRNGDDPKAAAEFGRQLKLKLALKYMTNWGA